MGSAASALPDLTAGGLDATPEPKNLSRRAARRRQMLDLIGVSFLIDSVLLLLYAYAGTIPAAVGIAYCGIGLLFTGGFILLSESGLTERFSDHYAAVPQAGVNLAILLGFAFCAPKVGFLFLCTLFINFGVSSLRATPRQTAALFIALAIGMMALFLLTDRPISMPHETHLERVATMLVFVLALGRCMFIGIFSSSLRESLYRSSLQLKEACKRIEELAELDELTGAFNRRCIMKMLDDEIARARRDNTPCSVALIDLDWFKQINDVFGHPTGDEVLRTFSITMFANIRSIDSFGRYGGEEFLLILPGSSASAAERSLERLRTIVAGLDWSAFSSGMVITLSAGVTSLKPDETADALLARADSALYAAKERGRNRIARA